MKELELLAASGHGRMAYDSFDPEFGSGIWVYVDQNREIELFERGLLYTEVGAPSRRISLIEVNDVISGLSAKVISEASLENGAETIVPLQLVVDEGPIVLGIPLIVYSGLLIAIQTIRRAAQRRNVRGSDVG
jgi:hypothetical protein